MEKLHSYLLKSYLVFKIQVKYPLLWSLLWLSGHTSLSWGHSMIFYKSFYGCVSSYELELPGHHTCFTDIYVPPSWRKSGSLLRVLASVRETSEQKMNEMLSATLSISTHQDFTSECWVVSQMQTDSSTGCLLSPLIWTTFTEKINANSPLFLHGARCFLVRLYSK